MFEIDNCTIGSTGIVTALNETGMDVVGVVLKFTYCIDGDSQLVEDDQAELNYSGEYFFEPGPSSLKYEPETAFFKPSADIVLIGHAHATQVGQSMLDVGLKVGNVQRIVRVFGDRYWVKTGGRIVSTKSQPFERVPLVYERAFGGWDKASRIEDEWMSDQRNPVGVSYGDPLRYVEEGKVRLPNIEDPRNLISRYGDSPSPAGLGFISPDWQQRAQFAGTYDSAWDQNQKPLLPADFDRRFFNAASPGLIASHYLRGGEDVVLVNASPRQQLKFSLPVMDAPVCTMQLANGAFEQLPMNFDTLIINTDEMKVYLLWRAHLAVEGGVHAVDAAQVASARSAEAAATTQ